MIITDIIIIVIIINMTVVLKVSVLSSAVHMVELNAVFFRTAGLTASLGRHGPTTRMPLGKGTRRDENGISHCSSFSALPVSINDQFESIFK